MKKTIILNEFIDEMMVQSESISYEGLIELFDYLEQLEEDIGVQVEFNAHDIHAEYSEYEEDDLLIEYSVESIEELEEKTTLIPVEGTKRYIINTWF